MARELYLTPLFNNLSLKAYYRFSSGALTTDSKDSHTLTAISDPAEDASGKFGGAVVLDGNDGYYATDHSDFKPTGVFTMGAWIKTSTTTGIQNILTSFNYAASKFAGIQIRVDANKFSLYSFRNTGISAGTDYQVVTGGTSVSDGNWHLVVGTWDGSYLRVYVDGTSDATAVAWSYAPGYQATNYVQIGYEDDDTNAVGQFFNGSLDDLFIFNGKALSATEISNLYNGTWPSGAWFAFL